MFLEHVEDNCLTQTMREATGKDAPLDLLFVIREGLVGDVMTGGCSGQSKLETNFQTSNSQTSKQGGQQNFDPGLSEMMPC